MLGAERLVYGSLGDALFTVRIDATMPVPAVDSVVHIRADAGPRALVRRRHVGARRRLTAVGQHPRDSDELHATGAWAP